MAPPPNMEAAELIASAIKAHGEAVAAAITNAAQPSWAEIWGLGFAAIVAVAVAAKAVIAVGKLCWPRGGEEPGPWAGPFSQRFCLPLSTFFVETSVALR